MGRGKGAGKGEGDAAEILGAGHWAFYHQGRLTSCRGVRTPRQVALFLPVGLLFFLYSPFPNQWVLSARTLLTVPELLACIDTYQQRERRFGLTSAQLRPAAT